MSVTYEQALEALSERLSDDALAHSKGVADTAALLAGLYGVDGVKARIAGLLHDWHRELDDEELLEEAREADLHVLAEELHAPRLLHARTGAADVEGAFPCIDDEIVSAIARHTVGSPDMTDLDKVVWVADMIEPHRDFDGVDDLREAVGTVSLDDLFALAYQASVAYLVARRKRMHPATLEVWNALVARGSR